VAGAGVRTSKATKVVPRVIVKADDQDARVVTPHSHNQVVQPVEVLMAPSQHQEALTSRPGQRPRIADICRYEVPGERNVVPRGLQGGGQAAAHVLVDQYRHGR
jgi:hypothetical protein